MIQYPIANKEGKVKRIFGKRQRAENRGHRAAEGNRGHRALDKGIYMNHYCPIGAKGR